MATAIPVASSVSRQIGAEIVVVRNFLELPGHFDQVVILCPLQKVRRSIGKPECSAVNLI